MPVATGHTDNDETVVGFGGVAGGVYPFIVILFVLITVEGAAHVAVEIICNEMIEPFAKEVAV
jgi:hypothetical protein